MKKRGGFEALELPVSEIEPNPNNPRKSVADVGDLESSIKAHGLLSPILVTPISNSRYRIIAGHRRFQAVKNLGHSSIAAIVRKGQEPHELSALQLIENLHRKDLDPFEEADAIMALIEKHGVSQNKLASELGMSKSGINQKLRLCTITDRLRNEIQTSEHPPQASTLLEIAKIDDPKEQFRIWRSLRDEGRLTVRGVKEARKRGSYEKRYKDFNIEEEGLKVMIRWDRAENDRSRIEALKMVRRLIDQKLKAAELDSDV